MSLISKNNLCNQKNKLHEPQSQESQIQRDNQLHSKLFIISNSLMTTLNYQMSISSSNSTQKKPSKQSLGKIYTTKRQPLTQILFYPKSALIDDYYLDHLHGENTLQKQKVIKFVGDQEDNIKMILTSLDALNQAQNKIMMAKQKSQIENEFSQILRLFYQKINKIRGQRDSLKLLIENKQKEHASSLTNLQKDLQKLREEIVCLKKEKECLMQKLENESKKRQYFERQNLILLQKQKILTISSPENFNLLHGPIQNPTYLSQINQNSRSLLDSQTENLFEKPQYSALNSYNRLNVNKSNKSKASLHTNSFENQKKSGQRQPKEQTQQLERILKKYNLQPSQLQDIIEEYSRELSSNHQMELQTLSNERSTSFGKKSQSRVFNKKVKKEIDKLMNSRN